MTEIQTKICTKCKVKKSVSQFHKSSKSKSGYKSACKECTAILNKQIRIESSENIKKQKHDYYLKNKDLIKNHRTLYRKENAQIIAKTQKEYAIRNSGKISEYAKKWRQDNAEKLRIKNRAYNKTEKRREYVKKYQEVNKILISEKKSAYYQKIKPEKRMYRRIYEKKRSQVDALFLLRRRIKSLIRESFLRNGTVKKSKTQDILGCSFEEFKHHIESQFKDGMSWENRSEWHIDHFIPLASAKNEEEILKLNHYTNLRPMWAVDNIRKGAKMPHEHDYK